MSQLKEEEGDSSYAYMCAKCKQIYLSLDDIKNHDCLRDEQINEVQSDVIFPANGASAKFMDIDQDSYVAAATSGATLILNDKGRIEYGTHFEENQEYELQTVAEEYELTEIKNVAGMKRKRNYENNDYIMNKLVRDPYFKLDRNTYTFKDTLGDWSETSTKLLIKYVGKYPKAHFLLQYYHERRLSHWEQIYTCMVKAGYNFTVLQLRMRWRELFAKYRWTLNHNDLYSDKKSFEYMNDMDELFGLWPYDASSALISAIESTQKESGTSKTKRLGYNCWERITESLIEHGYSYDIQQVEARWRMLVTSYKSMLDHNIMPTVEPIAAAFSDRLSLLVVYEPRRRKDYEKYKGKKVKLEKFPENGMKHLIRIYKEHIDMFLNCCVKNTTVWDEIKASLDSLGYSYTIAKIKEIFFATLKLYERILQHNSIPGAIKREGPHYKELSEIYNQYGFWPHVKRKRKTIDQRQHRKFTQKLRESMQTFHPNESIALLTLYPEVMEKLNGQPADDLWVQLAHSFRSLGFKKRDTHEIAAHIGLLRQGYSQGNNFPFVEQMQRVMEVEEAFCCSPDVSKYTGDVQILYWSHEAIILMLNLYLNIQPLIPFSSMSKEVYSRIAKEMAKANYKYTNEQIEDEFRTLLVQFTTRRCKPEKSSESSWTKSKSMHFCREEMKEVMKLRSKLSVGFTNGIKPIPDDVLQIILYYGLEKMEQVFGVSDLSFSEQKERMAYVIREIRKEIKKVTNKKPPAPRKVCMQLLSSLSDSNQDNFQDAVEGMREVLANYSYDEILSKILTEIHDGSYDCNKNFQGYDKKLAVKIEPDIANHQTICIYNDYNSLSEDKEEEDISCNPPQQNGSHSPESYSKQEDSRGEISSPQTSPWDSVKIELEINESMFPENNPVYYVDREHGTRTTVMANENSEVMINIDDLNVKKEIFKDELSDEELALEDFESSCSQQLDPPDSPAVSEDQSSECDSERFEYLKSKGVSLFEIEAAAARAEEKKTLEMLEHRKIQRRKLYKSLLSELRDIL